jgi:hypothetical protein
MLNRKARNLQKEYLNGLMWAKLQIQSNVPEEQVQGYLDTEDAFDKGARDYLCGKDVLEA